ncbi:hypothetical protein [Neobacillus drentensis]|uniref:hypothetical protein n=1 Tax=Neobacillus drentensis TaxID=220684 RepID=UPI002FFF3B89
MVEGAFFVGGFREKSEMVDKYGNVVDKRVEVVDKLLKVVDKNKIRSISWKKWSIK